MSPEFFGNFVGSHFQFILFSDLPQILHLTKVLFHGFSLENQCVFSLCFVAYFLYLALALGQRLQGRERINNRLFSHNLWVMVLIIEKDFSSLGFYVSAPTSLSQGCNSRNGGLLAVQARRRRIERVSATFSIP